MKTCTVLVLEFIDESECCPLSRGDQASMWEGVREDRILGGGARELPRETDIQPEKRRVGGCHDGGDRGSRGGGKETPSTGDIMRELPEVGEKRVA